MDLQKIGSFLSQLRKEKGWTQEQLGQHLGVTNKTVSRWENGNYLPPAEMLQLLSELYNVSINELLSGEWLAESAYRERAEQNIAAVLNNNGFTRRERLALCGRWLRKNWWVLIVFLVPAGVLYVLRPFVVGDGGSFFAQIVWLLLLGMTIIANHLVFYVCRKAYDVTKRKMEFETVRLIRVAWCLVLAVMVYISIDLSLALMFALTPAGTADGYLIRSVFYDILIEDSGVYVDNCYNALQHSLWQTFGVGVINLDLGIMWMKKE